MEQTLFNLLILGNLDFLQKSFITSTAAALDVRGEA